MMIVLELLAFRVPALRAYFAAVLKFMYDADVLSEKTILRWESHTLKHRFSCLTEKFVKELKEAAEPMIVWLNEAPVSGEEEEGEEDEDEDEDENGEGEENENEEENEDDDEDDDDEDDDEDEDDDDDDDDDDDEEDDE